MEFEVQRASQSLEKRPCKEAFARNGSWFLEIVNLDALTQFIEKNGRCVIYNSIFEKKFAIMIYDGYIE